MVPKTAMTLRFRQLSNCRQLIKVISSLLSTASSLFYRLICERKEGITKVLGRKRERDEFILENTSQKIVTNVLKE